MVGEVTATVVTVVSCSPDGLVMVMVVGLVKEIEVVPVGLPATRVPVPEAVALAESVTVPVATAVMVAPDGMPVPETVMPVARPTIDETAVTAALPEVVVPVKLMVVIALESVTVVPLVDTMRVPAGMPWPVIG